MSIEMEALHDSVDIRAVYRVIVVCVLIKLSMGVAVTSMYICQTPARQSEYSTEVFTAKRTIT